MITFSKGLKSALETISSQIAPDCDRFTRRNALAMAEMTVDGGRLQSEGYLEEAAEWSELMAVNGYEAVLEEAAKHVCTE